MNELKRVYVRGKENEVRSSKLVEGTVEIDRKLLPDGFDPNASGLVARVEKDGKKIPVPSQFSDPVLDSEKLVGRLSARVNVETSEPLSVAIAPTGERKNFNDPIKMAAGPDGPQHRLIENDYYKVETLPTSGQIWHIWNKAGANTAWHHHEWTDNKEKGGDPCHWSPNCWMAYPERITNGYEFVDGEGKNDLIDWHYVFGWENPETEILEGPVYTEIRRRGIVWPHPEHSRPKIERDDIPRIQAEVTYRFFPDSPFIYQTSRMELLEDINVFFIRNCQFVFFYNAFTHLFIMPDRDGLKPGDDPVPACIRLMGEVNQRPYDQMQHSLSNILPPKLDFYALFNSREKDGFGLFQLEENNYNKERGKPAYHNHATILTEVHEWSTYLSRTFSYSNRRFHPEMVNALPKGEVYEERNVLFPFRYENVPAMEELLRTQSRRLNNPLQWETTKNFQRINRHG